MSLITCCLRFHRTFFVTLLATKPDRGLYFAPIFWGLNIRMDTSRKEDKKAEGLKSNYLLIGVGTMLTSMIASGFLLGYLVDEMLETNPIFMLLFGGLGLVGGFIKVYKLLSRLG